MSAFVYNLYIYIIYILYFTAPPTTSRKAGPRQGEDWKPHTYYAFHRGNTVDGKNMLHRPEMYKRTWFAGFLPTMGD